MADPEGAGENLNPVAEDDRSLLQKAGDALGLGGAGDDPSETPEQEPIITDEAREETAAEAEADRCKAIRMNMGANQHGKNKRIAGVRAGK